MKAYADTITPSKIAVGDLVLAHQRKQNKLSTPYDPRFFWGIRKRGTMITACQNGKYITRNVSHFKKVNSKLTNTNVDDDEQDDKIFDSDTNLAQSSPNSLTDGSRRSQRIRRPVIHFGQGDD